MMIRRYRWYLRLPSYMAYRRWLRLQSREIPTQREIVVFDFAGTRIDGPQGRRVYALMIFFVRAGFHPVIWPNYLFLANIRDKLKGLILAEQYSVGTAQALAKRSYVLITDFDSPRRRDATRVVHIDYRPGYTPGDASLPMPFSLFPKLYADGQDQRLAEQRTQARQWSIFFGGDAEPAKYSKPSIPRIYGKVSRPNMLDALRAALPSTQLADPKAQAEFDALLAQSFAGLVIMNTRHCKVPPAAWLSTLAKARFFLACPGYRYPMSHNVIEALAVGSVPILEYPEQFYPALQNGVNCLTFNGVENLKDVAKRALAMPDDKWATMRDAAITYYEQHLAPQATVDALMRATPDADNTVHLRYLPFFKPGGGFA